MSWKRARLGDVAIVDRDGVTPENFDQNEWYVGLEHIDPDGSVSRGHTIGSAQLKSTKFRFSPRHVLYGKLRPNLRKVVRPTFSGVCSTDILPIRPGPLVTRDYLYHYLRSPEVVSRATRLCAGANLPRISPHQLADFEVPYPTVTEQQRIAAILDKADAIRRQRREALRLTDTFLRSVFLDLFGDPATNPKSWPESEMGRIVRETKLGLVRSSEQFGWDMPVPYVRMDAISDDGRFLPKKVQRTNASKEEISEYGLTDGDFLFNTRNSRELVGKVAVYPGPAGATFNNNIMRIRFREGVDPYFVLFQFRFSRVQQQLETRKQGTTSVFAVYWRNLATLPLLIPPKPLQWRFRAAVDRTLRLQSKMDALSDSAEETFSALQYHAFRGEL